MTSLLTIGNPKIRKGEKRGYYTAVLHLAPYNLSGRNVCPMAKQAKCHLPCLNKAGRGGINKKGEKTNVIQKARIWRTNLYFEKRDIFMLKLKGEIYSHIADAMELDFIPVFRLNATSDLVWDDIIREFPTIQFYDYTKVEKYATRDNIPANLNMTMSYYPAMADKIPSIIGRGINLAVVFRLFPSEKMPETWNGYPVFDGDDSDLRFLDPKGHIIGLRAKGPAKKDKTGFVVDVERVKKERLAA